MTSIDPVRPYRQTGALPVGQPPADGGAQQVFCTICDRAGFDCAVGRPWRIKNLLARWGKQGNTR